MRADLRLRQVGESYKDYAARMAGAARAAELDRDKLADAIGRLRVLHQSVDEKFANGDVRAVCTECGPEYYPCPTIRVLTGDAV